MVSICPGSAEAGLPYMLLILGVQERKLGDEERADLERQAADLGVQLEGGAAQPEQLQRAAAVYATLGRAEDAAGALEQLVEKAPGNSSAWGMLVGSPLNLRCRQEAEHLQHAASCLGSPPDGAEMESVRFVRCEEPWQLQWLSGSAEGFLGEACIHCHTGAFMQVLPLLP